jgi:hypothetical protein
MQSADIGVTCGSIGRSVVSLANIPQKCAAQLCCLWLWPCIEVILGRTGSIGFLQGRRVFAWVPFGWKLR